MFSKLISKIFITLFIFHNSQARVGIGDGQQDWGYVEVRPNAHMFWWLYYTTADVDNYYKKPLVIWLQGGPGASSTGFGNFVLIGPNDMYSQRRQNSWVNHYNVLFIDNPVGTGFSYVENEFAFTTTNNQIATDLLKCIKQFFNLKSEFADAPTYIVGESYGGKMAIEFAQMWYKAQKKLEIRSNLKGVAMGDPWISPINTVLTYAPYLFNSGMIDNSGYEKIQKHANAIEYAIRTRTWAEATNLWIKIKQTIQEATNNIDFNNILYKKKPYMNISSFANLQNNEDWNEAILEHDLHLYMNGPVKTTLNINSTWGCHKGEVRFFLLEDFMKPVTEQVQLVLDKTDLNVCVYSGQLDLIVNTPGTVNWITNLNWINATKWKESVRMPFVINGIIEGYVKKYGQLAMYWINRSGHMVPADNPIAALAMMQDFTNNGK